MLIHIFCSLGQNKQNEPDEKVVSHFSVHFWNDLFFLFHITVILIIPILPILISEVTKKTSP